MIPTDTADRPSYEPRSATPAEMEYDWLKGIRAEQRALSAKLEKGYPRLDIPNDIDVALSRLEDAADLIRRRMNELDEGA